ncbi:c-type cytochrome biogenesis protein CcmI [Stappia indica]|uniref:Cytochrome c-type biogenesis protein CcmH n=1 Tax=Stappia indica TaxID=538381 RepID=A0A285RRV8_9HYPH|nr:c-type cytochrome biogenesis protein CcmI [Stappia indica]SOB96936.1 cytochrome c-type biogenesis protein CcmH [Stappia indica]
MTLWIAFSLLTVLAALAVLVPLARAGRQAATAAALHDAEVYKSQLAEVERDLDRGLISQEAAQAARTEIARRLIAADREAQRSSGSEPAAPQGDAAGRTSRLRIVQAAALVVVPLGAVAAYVAFGSPDLPDQPLSARLEAPAQGRSLPELVARVERHLADNPEDGRGWDVVAPVYMRMGRPQDAAAAYARAIRLLGSNVQRETDRGEALVVANSGIVSAEAHAAFERAVAMDAQAVKPRFFLALALTQENRKDEAIAAWQSLLADAQGGEAWAEAVRIELAKLGVEAPQVAGEGVAGPSREQIEAAQDMSSGDRQQMIRSMVDGLDARLAADGGSAQEWMQLMRALDVLGERERLRQVIARAGEALKDDPAAAAGVRDLARELGEGS